MINNFLQKHFFSSASLKDLAIIRIVIVAIQLFFLLSSSEYSGKANPGSNIDFQYWLTTIEQHEYKVTMVLKVFLAPLGIDRPDYEVIKIIWWVSVIAAMFALAGFITNFSLLFLSFGTTFLIGHFYSYQEYHHTEAVLIIFLWIITFSRCGYLYSIDSLLNKKRGEKLKENKYLDIYARWPVRTMLWIFVLVYFSAGFEKITSGFDWINGYTLSFSIFKDSIVRDTIGIWITSNIELMIFFSVTALLFELFFFLIMLFPRFTWIFLLIGAGFHTSIYVLHGPPFLQFIILYIVFLEPIRETIKSRSFFRLKLQPTG